jgi:hypothetical protein
MFIGFLLAVKLLLDLWGGQKPSGSLAEGSMGLGRPLPILIRPRRLVRSP